MGLIERIRNFALSHGYVNNKDARYEDDDYEDGDDEDGDEEDDGAEEHPREAVKPVSFEDRRFSRSYSPVSFRAAADAGTTPAKVVNIHTGVNSQQTVIITYPETIDGSGYICDYIRGNDTVVVNLDGIRHETAQRIVDFLSGVVHALDGDIQYISNKIFILAPKNVEITGKIKEELKAGGILATLKSSYR